MHSLFERYSSTECAAIDNCAVNFGQARLRETMSQLYGHQDACISTLFFDEPRPSIKRCAIKRDLTIANLTFSGSDRVNIMHHLINWRVSSVLPRIIELWARISGCTRCVFQNYGTLPLLRDLQYLAPFLCLLAAETMLGMKCAEPRGINGLSVNIRHIHNVLLSIPVSLLRN